MLDGVGGGLGLGVVAHVVERDGRAAGHLAAHGRALGVDGLEAVAGEGPLVDRAGLHGEVVIVVDPDGLGVGPGEPGLLGAVQGVLDGVGERLGGLVVLDVGQRDGGAAGHGLALGDHRGGRGVLVALVGLLGQRALAHHDGGVGLVDPGGARVGVGLLDALALDHVLDGVGGGLGLGVVAHPLGRERHVLIGHCEDIVRNFHIICNPASKLIALCGLDMRLLKGLHTLWIAALVVRTIDERTSQAMIASNICNSMGNFRNNVIPNLIAILNGIGVEVGNLFPVRHTLVNNPDHIAVITIDLGRLFIRLFSVTNDIRLRVSVLIVRIDLGRILVLALCNQLAICIDEVRRAAVLRTIEPYRNRCPVWSPLGVEDVVGGGERVARARRVGGARAVGRGVPAHEGVAVAREGALRHDDLLVGDALGRLHRAGAAIGVVGQPVGVGGVVEPEY